MESVTHPFINWLKGFPPEEYLERAVRNYILNSGLACPNCNYRLQTWKKGKQLFQCKSCGSRNSLKALSPFPGSKLPFRVWFMGLCVIFQQPEIGATKLQGLLDLKRYQTAWNIHTELKEKLASASCKEPFKLYGYDQVLFLLLEVLWEPLKGGSSPASPRGMIREFNIGMESRNVLVHFYDPGQKAGA